MIGTLVIVFREVLEAALVIGIVLAATRGVTGRGWWVGGGIAAGLFGSTLVAAFARGIAETAAGMGQEVFNASLLFTAVVMLGWHNVWMGRHGRELAHQMKAVGHRVRTGEQPLLALSTVISLAVLREGSEVVLFLYGIAAGATRRCPCWAVARLVCWRAGRRVWRYIWACCAFPSDICSRSPAG